MISSTRYLLFHDIDPFCFRTLNSEVTVSHTCFELFSIFSNFGFNSFLTDSSGMRDNNLAIPSGVEKRFWSVITIPSKAGLMIVHARLMQ